MTPVVEVEIQTLKQELLNKTQELDTKILRAEANLNRQLKETKQELSDRIDNCNAKHK